MLTSQIEKRWTAYGKKLETVGGSLPQPSATNDNELDIFEEVQNIKMDDGSNGPYGIPISTGVAITLIKNMLDVLNTTDSFNIFSLFKDEENNNSAKSIIGKLLLNSMGVTFDKSQLLRIISQPRCEGVRFYHALRKGSNGDMAATLVLVGVDKDGFDLNYNLKTNEAIQAKQNDTCESLVDDWGHPPGGEGASFEGKMKSEKYVLLRMAENQIGLPRLK